MSTVLYSCVPIVISPWVSVVQLFQLQLEINMTNISLDLLIALKMIREYYCVICEEERDPTNWFYYCANCNFAAQPHCILGNYPYINFGIAYAYENHQHPITFVEKTKFSSPCDACGNGFKDIALECTQCASTVHRDCLSKIGKTILEERTKDF